MPINEELKGSHDVECCIACVCNGDIGRYRNVQMSKDAPELYRRLRSRRGLQLGRVRQASAIQLPFQICDIDKENVTRYVDVFELGKAGRVATNQDHENVGAKVVFRRGQGRDGGADGFASLLDLPLKIT